MAGNVPDKLAVVNRRPPREGSVRLQLNGLSWRHLIVGFAATFAAALCFALPVAAEDLAVRLERALAAPALQGASLSVLVVDRETGATVHARSADRALVPASTQKLLTAIAALDGFGAGHRFETRLLADRPLDATGRLETLFVEGAGDASLTSEQWWRLAADLAAKGVSRVDGIVLDDSGFDRERWHPSWAPITSRAYHGPIGALTANYGAFRVIVTPGDAVGDPVVVRIDPPVPYFEVVNRAQTARSRRGLRVERKGLSGRDQIVVSGSVRPGRKPADVWRSVSHPLAYTGSVLASQLRANGIEVTGTIQAGTVPPSAVEVLAFAGHPMHHIVSLVLKHSSNMMAESLVKALARGPRGKDPEPSRPVGTWLTGMAEVQRRLEAMGVSLEGASLVDGSGLSRDNRVSARLLVDAMRAADRDFALGPDLVGALPIAGVDGTLRKRAEGARAQVRAKTGTLNGVTALAGFAVSQAGDAYVFAFLVNGYRGGAGRAMDAVDAYVETLVVPDAP